MWARVLGWQAPVSAEAMARTENVKVPEDTAGNSRVPHSSRGQDKTLWQVEGGCSCCDGRVMTTWADAPSVDQMGTSMISCYDIISIDAVVVPPSLTGLLEHGCAKGEAAHAEVCTKCVLRYRGWKEFHDVMLGTSGCLS